MKKHRHDDFHALPVNVIALGVKTLHIGIVKRLSVHKRQGRPDIHAEKMIFLAFISAICATPHVLPHEFGLNKSSKFGQKS